MDCQIIINFLSTLVGVILGGIITWLVSLFYYIRASKELKIETSRLRKLTELMLRSMQNVGWVEYKLDDKGNPIEIVFKGSIVETEHITDESKATVISASSETKDI